MSTRGGREAVGEADFKQFFPCYVQRNVDLNTMG